ncbi:MAG: hypothetical protein ONB46_15850 [candidate division KSB1 bacterium]|nr:hypothetical protein [candidate division KSB1 bacterium]MDZ7366825.1 hypothetical protein [candidate division KSB1 bacterium]MDZ7405168.1 hypothetical protein [candidate division KSB1 bacterium]
MQKSRLIFFAAIIWGILVCFRATWVLAQESQSQPPEQQPATSAPQTAAQDTLPAPVIDESGKNVRIFLDKVEVLGSIAKPQALFIIPGSDPKVDGIQIDRSFFREIFRPMEKDRFPRSSRKYPRGQIPW